MGIPELPTDNLYKFMATFGFLIAVLSFGYLVVNFSAQAEMIARLEVESVANERIFVVERDALNRRTEQLAEATSSLRAETTEMVSRLNEDPASISAQDYDDVASRTFKIESDLELLLQDHAAFIIQTEERGAPHKQALAALSTQVGLWRWLSLALLITGFAGSTLSWWGFKLWYRRVQVHQDAILARQAKSPV